MIAAATMLDDQRLPPRRALHQLQDREHRHQRDADGQRRRPPGVGDLESRRGDVGLADGVVERGREDEREEDDRHDQRGRLGPRASRDAEARDQRGHPHVRALLERDDGAEHREPHEEDRRELVGPHQRVVEDIARQHAGEEHDDLDGDQQRRGDDDDAGEDALRGCRDAGSGRVVAGRLDERRERRRSARVSWEIQEVSRPKTSSATL